ncbi:MAG: TetR/AcrR family transcriptional regulator [Acidimicrobiales bacterium]
MATAPIAPPIDPIPIDPPPAEPEPGGPPSPRAVPGEELGRRDRKKLATRDALRAAALRLVLERGLHHVTVEDIAETADVSTRTFFNHFPSKEDAIVGLDPGKVSRAREALRARPAAEPPLQALHAVLEEMAGPMAERREEWAARMRVVAANPSLLPRLSAAFAAYERALVEGVAERTGSDPDRDLYPSLAAAVAVGALRASVMVWRNGEAAMPLDALLSSSFALVTAGLPAPVAGGAS